MSHQPFEDWILGDEVPTAEQRRKLHEHLTGCADCRRLQAAWSGAEAALAAAPMAEAASGFTERWSHGWEARRRRQAHWQGWAALAVAAGTAAVLGVPLVLGLKDVWDSPAAFMVQAGIIAYNWLVLLRVGGQFLLAVGDTVPEMLPLGWWLTALAVGLGVLGVWIATLYHFAVQRVQEGASK